jgi:CRP-like cAMP-binding protein
MDTTRFFDYPGGDEPAPPDDAGFLAAAGDDDWAVIREHGQVRRYAAGAQLLGAGETDRALYLVLAGTLERTARGDRRGTRRRPALRGSAPQPVLSYGPGAVLGERAFLEGLPFDSPVLAVTVAEVLRLGLTEFEVLAAKDPALGRYLLFDLARVLAARADPAVSAAEPDR